MMKYVSVYQIMLGIVGGLDAVFSSVERVSLAAT